LEDGPPRFPQGFSCPAVLGNSAGASQPFAYRTVTFFGVAVPGSSTRLLVCNSMWPSPTTPVGPKPVRFGLFRVRSPLLTESLLFSLPRGTEMVHFPRFASSDLCIQSVIAGHDSSGVAPFGHLRINACLPLPEAYRSLLRPSSPLCAKASTVNP
jgi:hypothetical protein